MPQFLSAFLAMLPGFTFGSLLAFAAVALPQVLACLAYKSLSLRKLDPVGSTVRYEVMSILSQHRTLMVGTWRY